MRIVFAGNLRDRDFGAIGINSDQKLLLGLIKNDYAVLPFSDRDVAHLDNPLGLKPVGKRLANRRLIEACRNFEPDLLILGLCDIIRNETITLIRRMMPALRVVHWNIDALFFPETVAKIRGRAEVCDGLFLTTAGERLKALAAPGRFAAYIPNMTDAAAEPLDNSAVTAFEHDLLYLGVGNPSDPRWAFVSEIEAMALPLRFSIFGSHGRAKVFGRARDRVLAATRMALNLNRIEGDPLYSSDRLALLMPNGIVTFLHASGGFQRFFSAEEAVFFEGIEDLRAKALALMADDARRRAIAAAGRTKYRALFNSARVARYLVETAMDAAGPHDHLWADEFYRV